MVGGTVVGGAVVVVLVVVVVVVVVVWACSRLTNTAASARDENVWCSRTWACAAGRRSATSTDVRCSMVGFHPASPPGTPLNTVT